MSPQTFNGYLNEKREDNLWPMLPKILNTFPDIRREWLFFEEGDMLAGPEHPGQRMNPASPPLRQIPVGMATGIQGVGPGMVAGGMETLLNPLGSNPLVQRIAELEAELRAKDAELTDANRLNRRLTNRLLIEGAGDKPDAQSSDVKVAGQ